LIGKRAPAPYCALSFHPSVRSQQQSVRVDHGSSMPQGLDKGPLQFKKIFHGRLMHSKVEFHCHTVNSFDCKVPLATRLEQYAALGFTHLAVTDHDTVLTRADRVLVASAEAKLHVIPAIEVSTYVGHIILLNCKRKPWVNSLFFLVVWSKFCGSEIYVPHPCRKGTGLLFECVKNKMPTSYIAWFLSKVKYVEVWNPRDTIKDKVKVHAAIVRSVEMKRWTVASDSHYEDDIYIHGCPEEGLQPNDPLTARFFSEKIEPNAVYISMTLSSLLRYIKSAIRYALN
jgi:hypothetical protein